MIKEENKKFNNEQLSEFITEYDILDKKILSNLNKNLIYNIKLIDNFYYFYVSINEIKLSGINIKQILKIVSEKRNLLNEYDIMLLQYLSQKLTDYQVYVRIHYDFEIYFAYLTKTDKKFYFLGENTKIQDKEYSLKLNFQFVENEIFLYVEDFGEILLSKNETYYLKKDKIYKLPKTIPQSFYEQIKEQKTIFTINSFLDLKKKYFHILKEKFQITLDSDLENLSELSIKTKIPKLVLEIDKTEHFIVLELKYELLGERFKITDYKYADTQNWLNKTDLIKIVRENGKLIKYISDESLTEDIFEKIFENSRILYKRYTKTPFRIILPLFQLNNLVNKVIPNASKFIEIDYKYGKKIELKEDNIRFEVKTELNKKKSLFSFQLMFKIEDEYIDIKTIEDLLKKSTKYIQLKNGKTINVKNIREITKWLQFLKEFRFLQKENIYEGDLKNALQLIEFKKSSRNSTIIPSKDYKNFLKEAETPEVLFKKNQIPRSVTKILRNYQEIGINWLHFIKKYGFGGILADEMGLGKTLQALTFLKTLEGKHIIITPKTLIYNWVSEIEKFFPNTKIKIIEGDLAKREKIIQTIDKDDYKLLITSYSLLQKDYEKLQKHRFNCMILDEAHYVKNVKTLSAKAVRSLNVETKILLTGTPLENNLEELYNAFDLMMPDYLGTRMEFSRNFISKIERNNMIALEILHSRIRPFILRRTKKQVLADLPEKQKQILYSEMTLRQSAIYHKLLKEVKEELNNLVHEIGFRKSRIHILLALLRLRQVCNHPALLDKRFMNTQEVSGKFEQFKLILREVLDRNGRILIFSQFTQMLNIIEEHIKSKNYTYFRLDGTTKNRTELVKKFNNDKNIKIFLISLKAGGVGLNLTGADTVFLYDPWWNPMIEKQAQDRAHRIGQTKKVYVYKFITKNSIEEKILKLQEQKRDLFNNLILEENGFIKKLSWEDLMELFD